MAHGEIGVVLDSFGEPVKGALRSASELSFRQVELPATRGEVDPEHLSRSGRRHLRHYVSGLGLRLSALGADLGGARFSDGSAMEQRLDKTRRVMEMAAELLVPLVTTHLGRLDEQAVQKSHVIEAVRVLAEMSDRTGTLVAFETGACEPGTLARVLADVNCATLGVCYDPASLLIDGVDPISGVEPVADRILIARARDAVAGLRRRPGHETAIGEGQIDFAEYLAALDQAGYRNTAFVRRTQAEHPREELARAREYLESFLR